MNAVIPKTHAEKIAAIEATLLDFNISLAGAMRGVAEIMVERENVIKMAVSAGYPAAQARALAGVVNLRLRRDDFALLGAIIDAGCQTPAEVTALWNEITQEAKDAITPAPFDARELEIRKGAAQ